MDNDMNEMVSKLSGILREKGFKVPGISTLELEIENAIGTINRCRRFVPSQEKPYDTKYKSLIIPMCVYSISKYGAEGETSHTENGITRMYSGGNDYPKEILSQITPLIK